MKNVQDLRVSYSKSTLDTADLTENPLELFGQWFTQLTEHSGFISKFKYKLGEFLFGSAIEPNAMTLSTIGLDGFPKSRTVLMKGMDLNSIEFFTNYNSDKAKEIERNPCVSVTFWWPPMQRQVIMRGYANKLSPQRNEQYFQSRPFSHKIGAIASTQSQLIYSREELERAVILIENRYRNETHIPLPSNWGGYSIKPFMVEFWQGRVGRLHDRFRYEIRHNNWTVGRISP